LYGGIISTGVLKPIFIPGTISQDIVIIISSVIMIILVALYSKYKDMRIFISIIGLLGFCFYAYGIYVITAFYTSIYFIYMVIFTLSIFGVIIGVSGFAREDINKLRLSKGIRIASGVFLSLMICVFVPMWIISMIPYIQNHTVPDFYAIFILDLCFFLPFFMVVIYMLIKDYKSVYILLGIALLKTLTLVLSVAIGEISIPAHGLEIDIAMVGIYCGAFIVSLLLYIQYCLKLKNF
jgi:hypothetical protein